MPTRTPLLLGLILATPLAWAQDDAARRAERAANNPMRMIIEAAKIKPKARVPEAPARPPESPRPAPRPAGEAATAAVAETRPAAAPPAGEPRSVAVAEPAPAPLPVAAAEPAVPDAAPPPPPAGPPESAVATVEVSATPRSESVVQTLPAEAEPEPAALKLASVVEPEMPRRLLGKLRGEEVQVHVAFTVRPDGSVADAAVRRSSHPTMDAAVLEAVRQWRYEPIAAARPHEVQLVLRQPE